jgi:hypothetical protein
MTVAAIATSHAREQIGVKLRRVGHTHGVPVGGIGHWCPGCGIMHVFAVTEWDGNTREPTFSVEKNLAWGNARDPKWRWGGGRCRYTIRTGVIAFASDCTHKLAGQNAPLPELPGHLRD